MKTNKRKINFFRKLLATLVVSLVVCSTNITTLATEEQNEDIAYTWEDVELLANLMYFEEGCFLYDEQGEYILKLAGSVVVHRKNSELYPDTIYDVIYQKGQYPTTNKFGTQEIPEIIYQWAEDLLRDGPLGPENLIFQSRFKQGEEVYFEYKGEYFCLGNLE